MALPFKDGLLGNILARKDRNPFHANHELQFFLAGVDLFRCEILSTWHDHEVEYLVHAQTTLIYFCLIPVKLLLICLARKLFILFNLHAVVSY